MLVRRSRQLPGISESGTESVAYRPEDLKSIPGSVLDFPYNAGGGYEPLVQDTFCAAKT